MHDTFPPPQLPLSTAHPARPARAVRGAPPAGATAGRARRSTRAPQHTPHHAGRLPRPPAAPGTTMRRPAPPGAAAAAHSPVTGLAVAVAYAGMSLALALLNKHLLSSYRFPCFFTLLGTQLAISLVFCVASRDLLGNPFGIEPLNRATLWLAAPMAVAYVLNVTVGMLGLQLTNVPMFFAIRRLVPACVVAYEWVALGRRPERSVNVAVTIIAVGAVAAGWETFTDDRLGYTITMANNVITAYMFVMQKAFSTATGLSTFSVVLYNAVVRAWGPCVRRGGVGGGGGAVTISPRPWPFCTIERLHR